SREHHAILIVSEVLKGELDGKDIPIIIHYGLTPVVGGYYKQGGTMLNLRAWRQGEEYPKGRIEIADTGSSAMGGMVDVRNAGEDNIWFLRRRSGRYGRKPGTGDLGIVDPVDLRPLSLRESVKAYLAKDGEALCRLLAPEQPAVARCAVVELLASMGHAPAAALLRELALMPPKEGGQTWPSVPRVATRALAAFPGKESRETLEAIAAGTDTGTRDAALRTLSEYVDRDVITFLAGLRKRLDPEKRADSQLIWWIDQFLRNASSTSGRTSQATAPTTHRFAMPSSTWAQ
ncbi:MAG: HEAT repeat domain-containing protein, partial [Planctomycetota bacterium]